MKEGTAKTLFGASAVTTESGVSPRVVIPPSSPLRSAGKSFVTE
jgi:hypothetical protein